MAALDGNTLDGVSATTLWTLHNRATEAARPGGQLEDPLAVELYAAIDYDYLKRQPQPVACPARPGVRHRRHRLPA
jgi:O-methyltransferase involved in polyketide biosynthesis